MALLLAPYNEGMRLGMGFNSYTQQLCVNDIVRRHDGRSASSKDLKTADLSRGETKSMLSKAPVLSTPNGTVVRKSSDGQSEVSQIVSWEAGFVDNLSTVTNSLNISGALEITCAAIAGGGGASAHYVDTTSFTNSDARYNITVRVTNQKLVAEDVTEFCPIANVPPTKFTEVYGDSFISGFIQGGVLNALVCKKKLTKDDLRKIGGSLKVEMDLKAVQVKGEAKGDKEDTTKEENTETKINLSWSGGGDIKPNEVTDWDIPNMVKVAMEFPDKVAACPQTTYAIITKYTSLRSFHEQTVRGSPLDYEIAGIYTSALLDSYMEYKAMWADLLQTVKDLARGKMTAKMRDGNQQLRDYGTLVKVDYDKRMIDFNKAKAALANSSAQDGRVLLEEPLPPNKVEPYEVEVIPLTTAAEECRYEMIKIVREVNELTFDPKVATDPRRTHRFLPPHIFKMLLPIDATSMPTREEVAGLQRRLQAQIDECKIRQQELSDEQAAHTKVKAERNALMKSIASQENVKHNAEVRSAVNVDDEAAKVKAIDNELHRQLETAQAEIEKLQREKVCVEDKDKALKNALSETKQYKEALEQMRAVKESQHQDNASAGLTDGLVILNSAVQKLNEPVPEEDSAIIRCLVWGNESFMGHAKVIDKFYWGVINRSSFTWDNSLFDLPADSNKKAGWCVYRRGSESLKMACGFAGEQCELN